MEQGLNVDQGTLITVLQNKLAQAAVREAQMEAAIQQLLSDQSAQTEVRDDASIPVHDAV